MRKLLLVAALAVAAAPLGAQANATLKRAIDAGNALEYPSALRLARAAIAERLTAPDLALAYQLLGTTYAAMDSGAQAQDAFRQLVLLAPEFDFDASNVSPKITAQYGLALAQVLVIRHLGMDSTSATFVAGRSLMVFRFVLTQRARILARLVGPGGSVTLDSSVVDPGTVRLTWNGLLADRVAPRAGRYRLTLHATSTGNDFAAELPLAIQVAPVDTAPHLLHLEGYDSLPEMVTPARNFRPLGVAALVGGIVAAGTLATDNGTIGSAPRRELTIGVGGTLLAGLVASFGHPVKVPSEANIRYNHLITDQLARQNQQIAAANVLRRQEVQLTVAPAPPGAP